jgi:hypothetical protein
MCKSIVNCDCDTNKDTYPKHLDCGLVAIALTPPRYAYSIFEMVEDLHMYTTGALDCTPDYILYVYGTLCTRWLHWQIPVVLSSEYDHDIRDLIATALHDYEKSWRYKEDHEWYKRNQKELEEYYRTSEYTGCAW